MAITGTPRVFSLSSNLLFPTPAPGDIPVLPSCIVLFTLCVFLEARASIQIITLGFTLSTIPFII